MKYRAGEGTEVKVTGSFDRWQSTLTLIKGEDGIFSGKADLKRKNKKGKPARVEYKYVVDGVWVHNEKEPFEKDPSGNINNVFKSKS